MNEDGEVEGGVHIYTDVLTYIGVKGGASSPMNGILFEVVELSSPLSQIHRPSPACGGRLE